ncbi:MAG: 4Fe-4S dicluster domain-containing protein [Bacteroidales bacterium]|nr:4Fe-4S dicluster domain-containing protein [Bacteroidales bacterium]
MGKLYDRLVKDIRIKEWLKACINCGVCVAICPAAEFYKYNPKTIVNIVQSHDDEQIEALLKSDNIWYCGECMSCMTRCPRKNAPGMIIMALRSLSIDMGYFVESEKGRQQLPLQRTFCSNILDYGYCVYPRTFAYEDHPESGTVGKWISDNLEDVHKRLGSNLDGEGPGVLRKIPKESLDDLKAIFDVTGATARMKLVEDASAKKAQEMGLSIEEYVKKAFNDPGHGHTNE